MHIDRGFPSLLLLTEGTTPHPMMHCKGGLDPSLARQIWVIMYRPSLPILPHWLFLPVLVYHGTGNTTYPRATYYLWIVSKHTFHDDMVIAVQYTGNATYAQKYWYSTQGPPVQRN